MSSLRILHITPWFPSPDNSVGGVFIAEHVKALNAHCTNEVLHIRFTAQTEKVSEVWNGIPVNRYSIKPILDKWRLKEIKASKIVRSFLKKRQHDFDIVNFYIAYPNAIKIGELTRAFPKIRFTISEQWSAYHQNFGLSENSSGKERIASIYKHNIPLFTVSSALGEDIRTFSKLPQLPFEVIPNIADTEIFNYHPKEDSTLFTFCSINNWSEMKNPFVLIDAFASCLDDDDSIRLILAGSGALVPKMKARIEALDLSEKIQLLGRISKEEVAALLGNSNAYCQSSHYETFSAICIEALACGTPIIATNIGGMKDFTKTSNGLLVNEMTAEAWATAMATMKENYTQYKPKEIAKETAELYNSKRVGKLFFDKFNALIRTHGK